MNTIDINTLDFTNAPAGFDRTDSLMNILIADIDDDKQAIIGFDIDTQKSSIAVGNPTTGQWADSADPQDWPALDRLFGRKNWQSFLRDHEQESRDMLTEDDPIAVTATVRLAGYREEYDFITFETEDGEQLEWIDENGATEEGVYVLACEEHEPYAKAAEQWLERLPGRYEVTAWD